MARSFVILLHTGHGPDHYDLMLESGRALATWQLPSDPADLAAGQGLPAKRLPDHRRAYLTHEGPVSRQRGHVRRVEEGTYLRAAATGPQWDVELSGARCRGRFVLAPAGAGEVWTLTRLQRP
jgi:hypothetical protein